MEEFVLEYDSGLIAARLERREKALVQGVSFCLRAGEKLSLIGETGSGKTMINRHDPFAGRTISL